MSSNNWNDLGEEFKNTINEAIRSGDFSNINILVNDTVNVAIDEAKKQTKNAVDGITKEVNKYTYTNHEGYRGVRYDSTKYKTAKPNTTRSVPTGTNYKSAVNKVGKVQGILFTVFGGIGLGVTILSCFIRLVFLLFDYHMTFSGMIVAVFFAAFFGWMIHHGCFLQKRVRRAQRYAKMCGQNQFVSLDELAAHMGKKKKYIVSDVHKMLDLGMYPEGHLDEQETCLILSNEVYKTYLAAEKSRKEKETIEAQKQQEIEAEYKDIEHNPELQEMIREGNECIRKLRDMNDAIEGEIISAKLFKLENLLKEIFAQVRIHPEKMREMHRLMSYYLPTTLKLVEAYAEFDEVKEPSEDIVQAKVQIENTLDTINSAFQELLNNLFRDKVYDVTTDAQVLQTLLSREGLVKQGFEQEREKVKLER